MNWMSIIVVATASVYFASTIAFLLYFARFNERWSNLGYRLLISGVVIHAVALLHLNFLPDGVPIVDESVFSGAAGLVLIFVMFEKYIGGRIWASLLSPVATSVVIASLHGVFAKSSTAIPEFVAVVTPVHIGASVLGIIAFLVAFVASVMYVAQDYTLKKKVFLGPSKMPAQTSLDKLMGNALKIGFPLYTIGIVLGAVWAIKGDPPGFSARYILAFLSWLVYGLVILGRVTTGWSGRKSAAMTMVGFLGAFSVLMGYFARWGG